MQDDRYKLNSINRTSPAGTLRIMAVFVGWVSVLCLCSLLLLWAETAAYGGSAPPANQTDEELEARFSAGRMIGLPVEDNKGREIAQIKDFIVDQDGRVQLVVLATGGFADIGEKIVAVPFADLSFERHWTNRPVRTDEGTTVDVPWQARWKAVYREKASYLKHLPEYGFEDNNLKGGSSGWGVYSVPAGPKKWQKVTDPEKNPEEVTGISRSAD